MSIDNSVPSTTVTGNVTVVQPTGTNLHAVVDSGTITTVSAVTGITNALPAGSNVIGHVIADTGSTTAVTGNVTVVQATGTNLHAVVDSGTITTVSAVTGITNALPAGSNLLGKVGIDQTTPGTTNAVAVTGGVTASGASIAANPLTVGARAATAPPTAVANAQVVNAQANIYGELVVRHALRETKLNQQTTITSSTSETTIVTADTTYKLDLYGLIITNTSSTFTKVTVKDSTAGTTRLVLSVPGQETRGFMLPASDGVKQNAANNNWTATCGTSVSAIEITALTVQNL